MLTIISTCTALFVVKGGLCKAIFSLFLIKESIANTFITALYHADILVAWHIFLRVLFWATSNRKITKAVETRSSVKTKTTRQDIKQVWCWTVQRWRQQATRGQDFCKIRRREKMWEMSEGIKNDLSRLYLRLEPIMRETTTECHFHPITTPSNLPQCHLLPTGVQSHQRGPRSFWY